MGANIGQGVDQSQTEYASDLSNIEGEAARRGAPAQSSGSFLRARQRAAQGLLGRSAAIRQRAVLSDAELRRQDMYRRLGAESNIFTGNTGLFNAVQSVKGAQSAGQYQALASLMSALSMGGGGMGGGGMSAGAVRNYEAARGTPTVWT